MLILLVGSGGGKGRLLGLREGGIHDGQLAYGVVVHSSVQSIAVISWHVEREPRGMVGFLSPQLYACSPHSECFRRRGGLDKWSGCTDWLVLLVYYVMKKLYQKPGRA